jgi:magnesium-transporting ATPase (P-type)
MATGDNTLTAVAVAKQCNIIDSNKILVYSDVENSEISWRCENNGVNNEDLKFI